MKLYQSELRQIVIRNKHRTNIRIGGRLKENDESKNKKTSDENNKVIKQRWNMHTTQSVIRNLEAHT